jgi:hypothetical protein
MINKETLEEAAEMNCVCKTKDCVHYKSFTSGALSDAARDYWFEKFKAKQVKNVYNKEDLKFAYMEGGDDESIYKTFYQWFENYKKK